METPASMCARLLAALEDLAAQEAASLATRDFASVVHLQQRAAPLVAHLAEHGPELAQIDPALGRRVAAWLARRHETGAWLAEQVAQARQRLRELDAARARATRLVPVYAPSVETSRRLVAIG
jgi:hypothetical protein